MKPLDAVAAVTHPDPYPYYRSLLAGPPLVRDEELGCWIAARASVVEAVLASPACAVRPAAQGVPDAIAGSPAGALFGRWARMNEGSRHRVPKSALQRSLAALNLQLAEARSAAIARQCAERHRSELSRWIFDVPVSAVADLLGFGADELPQVAEWMRDFVACLSPLSSPAQLAAASVAALALRGRVAALTSAGHPDYAKPAPGVSNATREAVTIGAASPSLAASVQQQAREVGWDDAEALLANLVGLLSQTAEATAALIGNGIVALASRPMLLGELRAQPSRVGAFVREVARHDAPVQNTRRFVVEAARIAGTDLRPGDSVLLVLAAANRDPALNADPDELLIDRPGRRGLGFGYAHHACPGEALACVIAAAALRECVVAENGGRLHWPVRWSYRPSLNVRMPQFDKGASSLVYRPGSGPSAPDSADGAVPGRNA